MNKRHLVNLPERERAALRQRLPSGRGRARELLVVTILLVAIHDDEQDQ